jgi:hypothetical protein
MGREETFESERASRKLWEFRDHASTLGSSAGTGTR